VNIEDVRISGVRSPFFFCKSAGKRQPLKSISVKRTSGKIWASNLAAEVIVAITEDILTSKVRRALPDASTKATYERA
jgi:hypothetical protein